MFGQGGEGRKECLNRTERGGKNVLTGQRVEEGVRSGRKGEEGNQSYRR